MPLSTEPAYSAAAKLARGLLAFRRVEFGLTIRAWLGLWFMWARMRLGERLLEATGNVDKPALGVDRSRAIQISTAVSRAARCLPVPSTCLGRSLVLHSLLASEGFEAFLRIGVRTGPGGLEAHAWIEFAGVPLNDREDIATSYQPFDGVVSPRGLFNS